MKRIDHLVSKEKEIGLSLDLSNKLIEDGFNSSNTVVVTVSTDYSSTVGQIIRHQLSFDGEICDGFGIDVPYPDQKWDEVYLYELEQILNLYYYKLEDKKILLVEAGVIRGGNYNFLLNFLQDYLGSSDDIYFLTLFENKHSIFKSDYVGEYYDDETQDLTFWWEKQNNHWR